MSEVPHTWIQSIKITILNYNQILLFTSGTHGSELIPGTRDLELTLGTLGSEMLRQEHFIVFRFVASFFGPIGSGILSLVLIIHWFQEITGLLKNFESTSRDCHCLFVANAIRPENIERIFLFAVPVFRTLVLVLRTWDCCWLVSAGTI